MKVYKTWDEDYTKRQAIGIKAESMFQASWMCECGGLFDTYYEGKTKGSPDFKCDKCGKFVEVKSNTQNRKRDNVAISQYPFENYPHDTLIAYLDYDSTWIGIYRRDAVITSGPHQSTHSTKPTSFYWISLENFGDLSEYLQER